MTDDAQETLYTFREYQQAAGRTANRSLTQRERIANHALGLNGEAGELGDYIKKGLYHGHEMERGTIAEELGDLLWYIAQIAADNGLGLDAIARANIEKLRRRYPAGFSEARSRERGK